MYTKKRLKWAAWIVLTPVLLVFLAVVLLYVPFVQRFAIKKVTQYVSESIGMNVHIGDFRLSVPFRFSIKDVYMTNADLDTILYVTELNLNLRTAPLLDKVLSVSRLDISGTRIHSGSLIEGIEIDGVIGTLAGHADYISLLNEEAIVNGLQLSDAELTIRINSLPQSDTVRTKINWRIGLEKIQLENLAVKVQLPADTIQLMAYLENISLSDGTIDLNQERYGLSQLLLAGASIHYDLGEQPTKKGLDPSHIILSNLHAEIDSIMYQKDDIQALIQSFSADERSGLTVTSLTGKLQMNDECFLIPHCTVKTPFSTISAQITLPRELSETNPSGFLYTQLTATVDKRDLEFVVSEWPNTFAALPSDNVLTLSCWIEGDRNKLYLHQFTSEYAGIFQIDGSGFVQEVMDSVSRSGLVDLTAAIQGKTLLNNMLPDKYAPRFSLPDTVRINLHAALQEGNYSADMLLSELQGTLHLLGTYNPAQEEYSIDLKADNIAPIHFLPQDSVLSFTGTLQAEGKGIDVFAAQTRTQFSGVLTQMQYKDIVLSDISLNGSLNNQKIQGAVASTFPYIRGNMTVDGNLQKDRLSGMWIVDMDTLDLFGMKMTTSPFANSFQMFSEFDTDMQKRHQLDITLGNWDMFLSSLTVSPKTLILHAKANEDTTQVSLHAGDLGFVFTAGADFTTLTNQLMVVADSLTMQIKKDSLIDFPQLRLLYPQMNLRIEAQNDNPVYNYLQNNNIFFDRFYVNTTTSPDDGLKIDGALLSLISDTLKIDTIRLNVWQDTTEIKYAFDMVKNRFRRQEAFVAGLKGSLQYGKGNVEVVYRNEQGNDGFLAGLRAEKQPDGINIEFFPATMILAYQPFQLNDGNYIKVKSLKDISADLQLKGNTNSSLSVHSIEKDGEMQELLAEINAIDLNRLSTNFLQMPSLQGMANMSFRYVPEENTFMIVAEANVNNLVYQGGTVGNMLLNSVYLPLGKGEHQLDINLFHNEQEISTLTALYQSAANGRIDGTFDINKMALSTLNPFFVGMARMNGALESSMAVSGTAKQPMLNGYMKLDTASIYSMDTGSRFRIDENKVEIKDNTMRFDRYAIYAEGNNPLTIDGRIDLNINNPAKSMADLRMTANNMQLLDSRKDVHNIVYGRLFVNVNNFTAKGPVNALVMRGTLNLLENTNMTYILKESPLTVQDRMANLVTFSYFRDTIPRRNILSGERFIREAQPVGGMDLQLAIRINPAVKFTAELDEFGTNRIELDGGGDLSFRYTPQGDMLLTGRYALSGGLIRYNMPVIANKTLRIKENSYVDWSGNPFDPYLNLMATERIRTNVSTEDGRSSRSVTFDAGIDLKQRMDNLSLQFTLEALDDASIQNQLTALGAEERSKRAVGLLLTGIYLDEDPSGRVRLDMGTALNSFLQTEINQLTGNLIKGVDFNIGMDNQDKAGIGATNYSFRFSKRFYNDRLNVVLGGNVSTVNAPNDNNTFVNDASIEYRLDTGGNRQAKLFYQRQYESLLEGEITKYGGGVVFRRKIRRLGDLFLFKKKPVELSPETITDH